MRLTGNLYDENNEVGTPGQLLSATATGTDWIDAPSGGSTTFLGLTDTPGAYTANQIFYTNAAGDAVTSSANFTFDGANLTVTGAGTFTTRMYKFHSSACTKDFLVRLNYLLNGKIEK